MYSGFERRYIDLATFCEIRLPRNATNARTNASGICFFLACKKKVPDIVLADLCVHFGLRFGMFWGMFFFRFGGRFWEGSAPEAGVV